jgi:rubrerythrin
MVVITKEVETPKRQVYFHGILETAALDCEEGLFASLLDLAIHHTSNYSEMYEHAAMDSARQEQKIIFLQLAYRKSDLLAKLKRYRSEFFLGHSASKPAGYSQFVKGACEKSPVPPVSLYESLDFAFEKENAVLSLYKKLNDAMHHTATKSLFDFLIAAQCDCLIYLIMQYSIPITKMNDE